MDATDATVLSPLIAPDGNYAVEGKRWVALLQLATLNVGAAISWLSFGIVFEATEDFFHMGSFRVNLLNAIFAFAFIVGAVPIIKLFDKCGVRMTLGIASASNITGCLLKIVAALYFPSFWALLVAQLLCSFAFVCGMIAPPLVASTWFPSHHLTFGTAIGSLSTVLGAAMGVLLPPLFITPANHGVHRWDIFFVVLLSLALLDGFLIFFVLPSYPKKPPSAFAALRRMETDADGEHALSYHVASDAIPFMQVDRTRRSIFETVQLLFERRDFVYTVCSAGLLFGGCVALLSLLSQIFSPFGYSSQFSGLMGFTALMVGIVIALPVCIFVDKFRWYRVTLLAFCLLFVASIAVIILGTAYDFLPQQIVFGLFIIVGTSMASMLPIAIELCVELSFPFDPTFASGAIGFFGNVADLVFVLGLPPLMQLPHSKRGATGALLTLGAAAVCAGGLFLVSTEWLRRRDYELASTAEVFKEQAAAAQAASADQSQDMEMYARAE